MSAETRPIPETATKELDATAKAVASWVHQLVRTLKTCRLYDGNNPTVIRFREELAYALGRLLDQHGTVTLHFTEDDVLYEEASLHPARSRDDNLAMPFHRDGIRSLTLSPGIEACEVEELVDAILQVTGQNMAEDDLVTLLWEAGFKHLDVDYVPSAGDIGSGELQEGQGIPWPQGGEEGEGESETSQATATETGTRSDDWTTGELTVEIEAGFAELDAMAPAETARFKREFEAEHDVSPTTTALAIVRAALATDVTEEDRSEFLQFTPRLLRLSVAQGAWLEAHDALDILRSQDQAALESLLQELLQPISVSTTVEHLDRQESHTVLAFVEFVKGFGDSGVDLLNAVLAESQQRRNRRLLAEAIAGLCRDNPERLAPYLSDRRWYVVRNIVHILGWIGGNQIVGMLRSALQHPEPRVRHEVVAALGQVTPSQARPVLLKLLDNADTRMFSAVLHQLSAEPDPAIARLLLGYLQDPAFETRATEERRAIYSALSSVAGDDVVPELEMELLKGNWFARGQEVHRQSVARVLARIGTPLAKTVLQRGLLSKRGPVKKACEDALLGMSA
jgi:hypothetical protein